MAVVAHEPDSLKARAMLALDDPFWGRSEYSYDRFSKHYQLLGGHWNDTYYTRSPG